MAITPKEKRSEMLGQRLVSMLQKRHFEAYYCANAEEALAKVSELVPDGSTVAWGGSATIREMGITKLMHERELNVIDRDLAPSPEKMVEMHRQGLLSDYFITSCNAISDDGVIVNVDGNGNRVAAMCFGPKNVIVICGTNKIAPSVEAAISRAREYAAPINAARFMGDTPCAKGGKCMNCTSPQSVCSQVLVTRLCKPAGRIKVVVVNEDWGF